MKVFISWSGDISRDVACILRDWLPKVIQKIEPYVSAKDIKKGEPWFQSISKGLDDARYGIICVTRENINSPWLHFEAGALFRTVSSSQSKVCPLLLGITPEDLAASPLKNLQAAKCEKEGMKSLLETLNEEAGHPISTANFSDVFETWWPALYTKLKPLLMCAKPRVVWAFETSDAKADVIDEMKQAGAAGFPVAQSWFLDDTAASLPNECDLLVYVYCQSSESKVRLDKVVNFAESHRERPSLIVYSIRNKKLTDDEFQRVHTLEDTLMSNMPRTLIESLKKGANRRLH